MRRLNDAYPILQALVKCAEVTRWSTGTVIRFVCPEYPSFEAKLTIPAEAAVFTEGDFYMLILVNDEIEDEEPLPQPYSPTGVSHANDQ